MSDDLLTTTAPAVPAHDPGTYRRLPAAPPPRRPRPSSQRLLAAEWERFTGVVGRARATAQRAGQPAPCRSE